MTQMPPIFVAPPPYDGIGSLPGPVVPAQVGVVSETAEPPAGIGAPRVASNDVPKTPVLTLKVFVAVLVSLVSVKVAAGLAAPNVLAEVNTSLIVSPFLTFAVVTGVVLVPISICTPALTVAAAVVTASARPLTVTALLVTLELGTASLTAVKSVRAGLFVATLINFVVTLNSLLTPPMVSVALATPCELALEVTCTLTLSPFLTVPLALVKAAPLIEYLPPVI